MVNDVTLKDVITMCLDMDIDEYKESRKKCPQSKRAPRLCVVEGCDGSASARVDCVILQRIRMMQQG